MHPPVLTEAAPTREVPFISKCGWCNCTQLPNGQWVDDEESGLELARHERAGLTISHGICPSCFALTVQALV